MPIYEYECTECGQIEEAIQKFSDKPLMKCKHCTGRLHKLVSQSSFHLKGTGWYVTDYANKSSSAPPPANTEKTDAKPDKKPSSKTTKSKKTSDASGASE